MPDFSDIRLWLEDLYRSLLLELEVMRNNSSFGDYILLGGIFLVAFIIVLFWLGKRRPETQKKASEIRSKSKDLITVHQRSNYASNLYDLSEDKTVRIKTMSKAKVGTKNPLPEPRPDKERIKKASLEVTQIKRKNPRSAAVEKPKKSANVIRGALPNLDNDLVKGDDISPSPKRTTGETLKKSPELTTKARKQLDALINNLSITKELEKKGIKKEEIDLEVLETSGVLDSLLDTIVSPVETDDSDQGKFSKMTLDVDLIFDD